MDDLQIAAALLYAAATEVISTFTYEEIKGIHRFNLEFMWQVRQLEQDNIDKLWKDDNDSVSEDLRPPRSEGAE